MKGNMKFHAKDAKRAIVNVLSFRRGKREEDIPHWSNGKFSTFEYQTKKNSSSLVFASLSQAQRDLPIKSYMSGSKLRRAARTRADMVLVTESDFKKSDKVEDFLSKELLDEIFFLEMNTLKDKPSSKIMASSQNMAQNIALFSRRK
jgi:hypothetical protein